MSNKKQPSTSAGSFQDGFDFFALPETEYMTDPTTGRRYMLTPGIVEDFGYRWGRSTTYDSARRRAMSFIERSKAANAQDESQLWLQLAVVFLVSGIEAFFHYAANHIGVTPPRSQKYKDYKSVADQFPNYQPISGKKEVGIRRLLLVRHAIVHVDCRITKDIYKELQQKIPRNQKIVLSPDKLEKAIDAADAFIDSVCQCDPTMTQDPMVP